MDERKKIGEIIKIEKGREKGEGLGTAEKPPSHIE